MLLLSKFSIDRSFLASVTRGFQTPTKQIESFLEISELLIELQIRERQAAAAAAAAMDELSAQAKGRNIIILIN